MNESFKAGFEGNSNGKSPNENYKNVSNVGLFAVMNFELTTFVL